MRGRIEYPTRTQTLEASWRTCRTPPSRVSLPRPPADIADTGDNLHFGLARLMAKSAGLDNVELVVVGDDVSVPRSRGSMVGRRCLAGVTLGEWAM